MRTKRKTIPYTAGLLLSILLLSLYIFQINSLTGLAWSIGEAERQLIDLKRQTALLKQNTSYTLSLSDWEEAARKRNFEKISSVTYIRIPKGPVAQSAQSQAR